MSDRYTTMFARLRASGQGAFVPFTVLGDPGPDTSLRILHALVQGGADALEVGIPFSDPLADGPVIQAAAQRALQAGTRPADALRLVAALRQAYPALPIGLLVYANLVEAQGLDGFYAACAGAGVDSVLVADVPTLEAAPYLASAHQYGVAPVMIATPNASQAHLAQIASQSRGYTYVVTRAGVTGADLEARTGHQALLARLAQLGTPPCLLGFGISRPEHVRSALDAGAAGCICGSAIVRQIEADLTSVPQMLAQLTAFVAGMKAATDRSIPLRTNLPPHPKPLGPGNAVPW